METEGDEIGFSVVWKIRNFSNSLEYVDYFSAEIRSNIDNMIFKLGIERTFANTVNFSIVQVGGETRKVCSELSLLALNGSVLIRGEHKILDRQNTLFSSVHAVTNGYALFGQRKKEFLPNDVLSIRGRIWKKDSSVFPLKWETILAPSCFEKESIHFPWDIRDFSLLRSGQTRDIQLEGGNGLIESLHFNAFVDKEDFFRVCFKTISQGTGRILSLLKVCIRDANNAIIASREDKKVIFLNQQQTVVFSTIKQIVLADKCRFSPALSLSCTVDLTGILTHEPLSYETKPIGRLDASYKGLLTPHCSKKRKREGDTQVVHSGSSMFDDWKIMYDEKILCDFIIQASSKSFQVHKAVLCARSNIFRALLTEDTKETRGGLMEVPDVDAETMQRFLLFLYSDELDTELQFEDASRLYTVADNYMVMSLRQGCSGILRARLSMANVCELLKLANLHQDDEELNLVGKDFVVAHYQTIVGTLKWKKFESENAELALKLLKEVTLRYSDCD